MRCSVFTLVMCLTMSCGKNENSTHKVFEQTMEANQEIMNEAKETGEPDIPKLIENFNKLEGNYKIFNSVEKNEGLKQKLIETIEKLEQLSVSTEPIEQKTVKAGQLCKECHNIYKYDSR